MYNHNFESGFINCLFVHLSDPVNVFNNSFTIPVSVSDVECRDVSGAIVICPFAVGSTPDPTFTAGTGTCSNAVLGVKS